MVCPASRESAVVMSPGPAGGTRRLPGGLSSSLSAAHDHTRALLARVFPALRIFGEVSELGRGGEGVVFGAEISNPLQPDATRRVAIKVLGVLGAMGLRELQRLETQQKVAGRISGKLANSLRQPDCAGWLARGSSRLMTIDRVEIGTWQKQPVTALVSKRRTGTCPRVRLGDRGRRQVVPGDQ